MSKKKPTFCALELTMKSTFIFLVTGMLVLGSSAQLLTPAEFEVPQGHPAITPSYHVDGRLWVIQDDIASHMFDQKKDSRDIFYVNDHSRTKRATSFSYTTPDSSRSEQFDTYVDPRVRDRHPLNRYQGRVSWTSPEGIPFSLDYSADGGGYHPQAHHLPDSPYHRSYFILGLQ